MDRLLNYYEVQKIADCPVKLLKYSSIINYDSMESLFGGYDCILLLYESKLNRGHWVCLIKHPDKYEFFDSYGFFPDDELNFTNIKFKKDNNMDVPYLTLLLAKTKKPIEYNEKKFQKMTDDASIASCGRHTGYRMRLKKKSLEEYKKIFKGVNKNDMDPLITYITEEILKK